MPSDKFKVEMITQEEEEDDDDDEFLWWHGLIIGVGGAVLVLGLLVVAIVSWLPTCMWMCAYLTRWKKNTEWCVWDHPCVEAVYMELCVCVCVRVCVW